MHGMLTGVEKAGYYLQQVFSNHFTVKIFDIKHLL